MGQKVEIYAKTDILETVGTKFVRSVLAAPKDSKLVTGMPATR